MIAFPAARSRDQGIIIPTLSEAEGEGSAVRRCTGNRAEFVASKGQQKRSQFE